VRLSRIAGRQTVARSGQLHRARARAALIARNGIGGLLLERGAVVSSCGCAPAPSILRAFELREPL
jgi:hypothetical protein